MERKGLEEYGGVKKIQPKIRKPRVTKTRKKKETMKLLSQIGVQDPEDIWSRLQTITEGPPPEDKT